MHNVIILGTTGPGKTYLANALGVAASCKRLTVKYTKLPDLMGELAVAYGEGRYQKVLKQYTQVKLLILDEWLLLPLRGDEPRCLFDLVDARYNMGSDTSAKRCCCIYCIRIVVLAVWIETL